MKKLLSLICLTVFALNSAMPAFCGTKTEENNYLKIKRTSKHLHSRLSKEYTGYEYEIKNIYNEPVTLETVSFWDDASGQVAYASVNHSAMTTARKTLGKGLEFAIPTLTISLIGSVVVLPFAIIGNHFGNSGAKKESQRFNKQNIQPTQLKPNEEIVLKTLALRNHKPSMRLGFKNPITDEIMFLEMQK